MRGKNNKQLRVINGFWFLLGVIFLSPLASAQAAPCLAYGYTESGNHQFLIGNNTSGFGNNITVIHNCETVEIEVDGEFFAYLSTTATIPINVGLHQINMTYGNKTVSYQNVMIYPDYLEWESTYQFGELDDDVDLIDKSILDSQTNWAVFIGICITWILCVYVYWNLINSFTQRNFIEEVVQ